MKKAQPLTMKELRKAIKDATGDNPIEWNNDVYIELLLNGLNKILEVKLNTITL